MTTPEAVREAAAAVLAVELPLLVAFVQPEPLKALDVQAIESFRVDIADRIAQSLERAEISEAVRGFIAARGRGRHLASTPSTIAENLSTAIGEYVCARVQPWSRSSRPVLAEYFRTAIAAVQATESDDDMPAELLAIVLGNVALRLDSKLQQIPDPKETTHDSAQ